MKIEKFSPGQTGEVKELVLGVLTQKGFEYDPGKDSDLDDITGYYHNRGGMFFVGTVDGEIIGTSAVRRIDSGKCEIKRIYVKDNVRRRGYGKKLFLHALEYARIHYPVITLKTDRSLVEAVSLYRKFGFSVIKEDENTLFFELS